MIPARRGSKRLADKNLLVLHGKPMVAHTILAARASGIFPEVVVSTEDTLIAEIALSYGAVVHERRPELAGDLVSATDVCIDALDSRPNTTALVCLQPSSPLRIAEDISCAWARFGEDGADFLVSVTQIDPHYFHWAVRPADNWWQMYFGDEFLKERPLLPPVFRPNGAIKIAGVDAVRRRRDFFGPRLTVYEMPEERSVHVATRFDLDLAEYLLAKESG